MKNLQNAKLAFLLFVMILIAGQFYFSKNEKTVEQKTRERAELIGKKLIDMHFQRKIYTVDSGKRTLASADNVTLATIEEGEFGRDSWGFPFHYKKQGHKLLVWSLGANHLDDSRSGDDILVELSL